MASDANAPARGTDVDLADIGEYGEMIDVLDTLLDEALRKVESGRVYDAEAERVRIKWIRIAKEIVAEKRKVKAERDIEELHQELDALKAEQGGDQ